MPAVRVVEGMKCKDALIIGFAQMLALQAASPARGPERQLLAGQKAGLLSQTDETKLLDALRLCWRLQAGSRLLSPRLD